MDLCQIKKGGSENWLELSHADIYIPKHANVAKAGKT